MTQHSSSDPASRSKSRTVRPLRYLLPHLARYRVLAALAFAALLFTAMVSLLLPAAVGRVVDGLGPDSAESLDRLFAAALVLGALLALGTGFRFALVSRLGERIVADIRKSAFDRALSLSPSYFERTLTGEVLSRINTDTTLILALVGSTISVAMRHMLTLPAGLGLMFFVSPSLALYTICAVPVVLVPILAFGRWLRRLSRDSQDMIAEGSGNASEVLLAVQAVQANTHEAESKAKFGGIVERSVDIAVKRITVRSVMTVLIMLLASTAVIVVTWIGTSEVRAEQMSWGDLVQFVIYSVMVAGSAAALSELWGELLRAAGAAERLVELMEATDSISDPDNPVAPPSVPKGEIEFERVGFRYPMRQEAAALKDVSFSVRAGETVALVGPSGAGKSTVFQLLLRFFDPAEGRVLLDGIDLKAMARPEFRKLIALVPQEAAIFADTAMENIRFGQPGATDEDVRHAAEAADADGFLSEMPHGYDTLVGERGVMLSGGQRQRIALARAILRRAPILLLDEATSSLDAESETAVQAAVEKLSRNQTTLVIAHRLSTVKTADRILVMDGGSIVAEGTHDTLVSQGGLYARLARLQFFDPGKVARASP